MTLPQERTLAVLRTRQFLTRLSTPEGGGIKGIGTEVRREARDLLRHFPGFTDMQAASESLPELFWLQKKGEERDGGD